MSGLILLSLIIVTNTPFIQLSSTVWGDHPITVNAPYYYGPLWGIGIGYFFNSCQPSWGVRFNMMKPFIEKDKKGGTQEFWYSELFVYFKRKFKIKNRLGFDLGIELGRYTGGRISYPHEIPLSRRLYEIIGPLILPIPYTGTQVNIVSGFGIKLGQFPLNMSLCLPFAYQESEIRRPWMEILVTIPLKTDR